MNIVKPTIRVTNLHIMSIRMIPTRILSLRSVCRYDLFLVWLYFGWNLEWIISNFRYNAAISKGFQVRCASQAVAAEKLNKIVSDISQLTLIEVAELNKLLKTALNIPDAPMMAYGAAPAAPAKEVFPRIQKNLWKKFSWYFVIFNQQEEVDEEPQAKVQTSFTLKLTQFNDSKKIALIKEIKNLVEGMNLVQVSFKQTVFKFRSIWSKDFSTGQKVCWKFTCCSKSWYS